MRKVLLLFSILFLTAVSTFAQDENNKIVLNVSKSATSISFTFRLASDATALKVNFGEGEDEQTFTAETDKLTTAKYTFKTTAEANRAVEIDATDLVTLRFSYSNALKGITSIAAEKLEYLNIENTSLSGNRSIDLSKCPVLKEATFNSSGIENVILPKGDKFETFQTSYDLYSLGNLKSINFADATGLKSIAVSNADLDTIDLRNNTNLTSLKISLGNTRLRAILGAKELKKLTYLNVQKNALGIDQIPDMYETGIDTDDWVYNMQSNVQISSDKINGNSVDVSHWLTAKGIANTEQTTTFLWRWRVSSKDNYVDVPDSCISYKDGVYTFDNTPLKSNNFMVFCRVTNAGFPGIGAYVSKSQTYNNYFATTACNLSHTITGIETVSPSQGFSFSTVDGGVRLSAEAPVQTAIYSLAGKQVWNGTAPATVSLPKGCYVVKPASGKASKFIVK